MFRRLMLSASANTMWRQYTKVFEKVNSVESLSLRNLLSGTRRQYNSLIQKQETSFGFKLHSLREKELFLKLGNYRRFAEQVGSSETSEFATGSTLGSSSSAASSKVDWRVKVRRAQRKRLYYLLGGMAGLATLVYSTLFAFEDRLMYFLTPTQTFAKIASLGPERRFRLGGVVVNGSFMLNEKEKFAEFVVTDLENEIPILFKGDTFPDLFGEGKSVVAEGYLRDGIFYADKILAKHDEYYIPKAMEQSIQRNPVSVYGALKSANVESKRY